MQQNPSSTDHLSALHFLVPPNPNTFSDHFFNNNNNNVPTNDFHLTMLNQTPLYNNFQYPSHHHLQDINNNNINMMINTTTNPNMNPCSLSSNNSTSDEAEEQQLSLINERKQRRMISNRESARRSRMRKQRHLDELWSQVVWLRSENHSLIDNLNRAAERHDRVVQENAQLREEATELRQMLSDLRIDSPETTSFDPSLFRDHDQFGNDVVPCNTAYLRAHESSSGQSNTITTSMDLLG